MGKCFRFGEFTLFPEVGDLYKKNRKVRISSHSALFLSTLLEAPGKVVSREILESRLWSKNEVGSNNLNVVTSNTRKVLLDNPANPKFIKTVGRRGYCFIHPFSTDDKTPQAPTLADSYWRGLYRLEERSENSLKSSIKDFKQAIADNPSNALAWAGLADAFIMAAMNGMISPEDAYLRARSAAGRALRIDPGLTEAKCSESWVKLCYDRNWEEAYAGFSEVIAAKPYYPFAWNGLSLLLNAQGRPAEAISAMRTAWTHDAVSPLLSASLGLVHYFTRRFSEAIVHAERALLFNEDSFLAHACLGESCLQLADYQRAVEHLGRAHELSQSPAMYGRLGYAYSVAGDMSNAQRVLSDLLQARARRHVPAYGIALVYLGLGDTQQALNHLEQAFDEHSHWVLFLRVEPMLDSIREDSRFASLVRRIGLP
jgi:DNA-binding winged helix-turn-helix (wHTH) protein